MKKNYSRNGPKKEDLKYDRFYKMANSDNTGYTVRFVRPNSAFDGTSQTPETLYEILLKKILTEG
jgi:hypothetical protein